MCQGRKAGTFGARAARFRAATLQVLGTDHAVHEANGEVQAVRVLQDAGELFRGSVHRNLGGFGQPVADQRDGFVGEGRGLGDVGTAGRCDGAGLSGVLACRHR